MAYPLGNQVVPVPVQRLVFYGISVPRSSASPSAPSIFNPVEATCYLAQSWSPGFQRTLSNNRKVFFILLFFLLLIHEGFFFFFFSYLLSLTIQKNVSKTRQYFRTFLPLSSTSTPFLFFSKVFPKPLSQP